MGIALAANLISVKFKFDHNRTADAVADLIALVTLSLLFNGTISGLIIATYASAIISVYLWFSPPKMPQW